MTNQVQASSGVAQMAAIQVSRGFHRFGIFLGVLALVVCIVMGAGRYDPIPWWIGGVLLALATYGLSRLLGWSINGFLSPPAKGVVERTGAKSSTEPVLGAPKVACHDQHLTADAPLVASPATETRWQPQPNGSPPVLGGWLLLPALSTFLSPIFVMVGLIELYPAMQVFNRVSGTLQTYIAASVAINATLAIAWVYACLLLAKRRRRFPSLFMGLLLISAVVVCGDIVAAATLLNIQPESSSFRDLGRAFVGVAIWVPYMLRSKRVAATFVA